MNTLPLPLAYLVLSQLAPPADFSPPARMVPLRPKVEAESTRTPLTPTPAEAARTSAGDEWRATGADAAPVSEPITATAGQPRGGVARANGTAPLAPVSSADGVALAAALIQDSVNLADPVDFAGEATSLLATIQHLPDSGGQMQAVVAYWRLSAAISQYAFAAEEVAFLDQVVDAPEDPDGAMLAAERAAAAARRREAQEAITAAQFDLAERSNATSVHALPWPNDTPLVGSYRTNFESLFGNRPAPIRLQRIHHLLPSTKRVIETRAKSASTARRLRDARLAAYQEGRIPLRSLLDTCQRLRAEQRAFLAAVLRYNEHIAEYALSVVGPAADPATVVSTLIQWVTPSVNPAPVDGQVRPASAEEPLETVSDQPLREVPRAEVVPESSSPSPPPLPQVKSVLRGIRIAH